MRSIFLGFRDVLKRRPRQVGLGFIASLVLVNLRLPQRYLVWDCFLIAYYIVAIQFAWKKTRKCPLEIMVRFCFWRWPEAFDRMYGNKARMIKGIYFPLVVLGVLKGVLIIYYYCQAIVKAR